MQFSIFYFASDSPEPQADKYRLILEGAKFADRHGFIWMSEAEFRTFLAPHAAAHQWALMTAGQKPISISCLNGSIPSSAWRLLPSSYLIAEHDHFLSAKTQRIMAQRMNAHIYAHPLDYVAAMTEPEVVLDVILEAAHEHLA